MASAIVIILGVCCLTALTWVASYLDRHREVCNEDGAAPAGDEPWK